MIIKYEKFLDWEPLTIELVIPSIFANEIAAIEEKIKKWLKNRDHTPICTNECKMKYLNVQTIATGLRISIEWMCKECLEQFLKMIEASFSQVESAIIGHPESPAGRIPIGEQRYIHVSARSVTMDNGQEIYLNGFTISHYPISVSQFELFANETGYVTNAESTKYFENYKNNGTLYKMDQTNHNRFEARFLSYFDATAFCQQRNLRLPSDAEFLAAITVDDEVRNISGKDKATLFRQSPQLLHLQGLTLTASLEGDDVVVRSGPWVTKEPGWNQPKKYKWLKKRNAPVGQFYVIKGGA